jgi:TIR domain
MSRIFLSYRRTDEPAATRLLREQLAEVFGEPTIFYDIETIPQGEDFVSFIERTIRACTVMLVVIGPHWLAARDQVGLRLAQPNDPVRIEIETALRLNKRLIPVLINDARMPGSADLPASIAQLHRQHAAPFHTNEYFKPDMVRLVHAITQSGVPPLLAGKAPPRVRVRRTLHAGALLTVIASLVILGVCAVLGFGAYTLIFTPDPTNTAIRNTISGFCTALHDQQYAKAYTYLSSAFQRNVSSPATMATNLLTGLSGERATVVGCREYGPSFPKTQLGDASADDEVDFDIRGADGIVSTLNARVVFFVYENNAWKISAIKR